MPPVDHGRRGFLGAALLGGGLLWACGVPPADAAVGTTGNNGTVHTGTAISGVYDVSSAPYNAKGDGVTNDATAIQNAINDASKSDGYGQGGGIVYLPAGNYYLATPLTISQQIVLQGAGWGNPYNGQGGTMFIVPNVSAMTSTAAITINAGGRGTILRDFAVFHIQPAPTDTAGQTKVPSYTPNPYPAAILVSNSSDISMESLLLANPTIGISLLGTYPNTVGRISLSRIYGQPLTTGVYIDVAEDTVTIDDIHFWSFWSDEPSVFAWMEAQGVAFDSRRNDRPIFSNIFAQHYLKMFYFSQSPQIAQSSPSINGTTHNFALCNCDADGCINGIVVDADTVTGTAVDVSLAPCSVNANNVVLQFTNVRLSNGQGALMYVSDAQSRSPDARSRNYVTMVNLFCEGWNKAPNGTSPAIVSSGASTVYVGGGGVFLQGSGPVYPAANQSPNVWYGSVNSGTLTVGT